MTGTECKDYEYDSLCGWLEDASLPTPTGIFESQHRTAFNRPMLLNVIFKYTALPCQQRSYLKAERERDHRVSGDGMSPQGLT